MSSEREIEPDIVEIDGAALRQQGKPGPPSGFACPDCGGGLFQIQERNLLQYRCRVGHAFSAASLIAQQSLVQEEALWAAIRSLEERAELLTQMASNTRAGGHTISADRFEAQAKLAQQRSDLIRQALFQGQFPAMVTSVPTDQGTALDRPLHNCFNVVVFVTQAGGSKSLSHILPSLPANFPAALIVVQHLDTQSDFSLIVDAFSRPTTLPFKQAQAGEPLQPGMVYLASPNEHIFVTPNGNVCLSQAAFVDLACPSADLLFGSVAAGFKERAIAVVLSGTGNDGAMGVQAIHKMGGKVIAQDQTADFFELPQAAIATGVVDFVLPLNEIAATLVNLVMN